MFDRFTQLRTSFAKLLTATLKTTLGLMVGLGFSQAAMALSIAMEPGVLDTPVDNIESVSPAPGSADVDHNNATLVLNYPTTADYEWTYKSALKIHNLETGEQVFEIDPDKTHSQQGLKSFTLKLDEGVLESGSRYGVTVDYRFAIVNKAPWKSGEITEGQWTFSTASDSSNDPNPAPDVNDGFSLLTIEGTTPEALLSDNGFEQGIENLDLSSSRASGVWTNDNAISGQYSVALELDSYGRVMAEHSYPYGADIFAKALQVYAKANVPQGNDPKALLKFCAVAYYFDNGRVEACQDVPGTQIGAVTANVVLDLDPTRKVNRVYNWIQSIENGPFKVTVDDMHLVMYRVGNNDQPEPDTGGTPVDSDGDGVADSDDAFPNDASESKDSDSDGVGDNADVFPNDDSESKDSDSDGVGDNADVFPNDDSESKDSDSDGVGDNADAFPNDDSESKDSDKDGVGDNADAFPNDASETKDSDSDGVGDKADAFSNDASETKDSDKDGVGDNADAFPNDATETKDTDGDGIGDNADDADDDFALLTIEGTTPEALLSDNGFEHGIDSLDLSSSRASGVWTNDNAISGQHSVDLELGSYGRVLAGYTYRYGADIFAKALQVYAKANVPEGNNPKALLKFCAVAYYFDNERVEACQDVPGTQTGAVTANVVLELDPTRKVNRVYNWIQSIENGPFKLTVDDMHLVMYRTGTVTEEEPPTDPTDPTDPSGEPNTPAVTPELVDLEEWQLERLGQIPANIDAGTYVATDGNDQSGDGSVANPYKTITYALSVADAGTTVTVRGGTYNEMVKIRKPNMTLRSKTGERAKIVQPISEGAPNATVFLYPSADGATLQGLEIVGGYYYAVMLHTAWDYSHEVPYSSRMGSTNVTIEDCIIHDSGRDAIKITPQNDFVVIRRNEIYNTGMRDDRNAEGIDIVNSDNALIQENYIHDTATTGVYCKGGATRCIVERNKIERAGAAGILVGFDTSPEFFDLDANPLRYENIDGIVRNNLIIDTQHSGIGIFAAKNTIVTNNTIVNTAQLYHSPIHFGLTLQDWAADTDPNDGIGFRPTSLNPVVINNIIVQPATYAKHTVDIRTMYHHSLGQVSALEGMPYFNNNIYYQAERSFSFQDKRPESIANGDLAAWKNHIQGDANSLEVDPLLDANYLPATTSAALAGGLTTAYVSFDFTATQYRDGNDIGSLARNFSTGTTTGEPQILDSDGDGVADADDAFPNDASESQDTDGDGVGNNADVFPSDATESQDTDGDGVGDNADAFPNDASETKDSDGDGIGDNADPSPNGSGETGGTDPSTANRDPIATGLPHNPIVFVSQLPTNTDFARVLSTFANHLPNPDNAGRGGDLYIRYQDGSLKNLTRLAGFGDAGEDQRENSISVRDPAVHWSGEKVIFSMVIGAPKKFARPEYYWQMYEVTGLGKNDTPVITKVENQPENYNNVGPVYGSDDRIIYASDMPLNGQRHLYPQHDEYESVATTTGLFSLDPVTGDFFRMVDSPSGSFDPLVARDGRVIMTNWDHLKRDQQATADRKDESLGRPPVSGTFNYSDESATAKILKGDRTEYFPEPEARSLPEGSHFIGQNMNTFLPWQVEQDGTEMEMLNHVGRHELFGYLEKRVNNDPSIIGQAEPRGSNKQKIENFLQMIEDPTNPGIFYGVDAPEFQTQGSGQIIRINGHASLNGNEMQINYVTSRNSNSYEVDLSKSYGNQNNGHYRDPLPLSNGQLIAVHTDEPGILVDLNDARYSHDMNYNYRLKYLTKGDDGLWKATNLLTSGLTRTINYYNPDDRVEYIDAEMWEVQPVEVVARPRPYPRTLNLPEPETAVFAEEEISLDAVKAYLEANDLALVISRNLTRRDGNDTQQPFNLCVADANNPCNDNSTKTLGDEGRVYDVSHLQFFQADRIRGIGGTVKPKPGRRVLAMPMHDSTAYNPINADGPEGSVKIAADGSMAALVPARRAMSWQLTNEGGDSIVAERFWVSFQPGEVRVCAVCHGLNESDQAGDPLPTNKPEALRSMLTHIKGLMGTGNTGGSAIDSDGDGVVDGDDDFPNDANETLDSDADGVGDNADVFPNDANETLDSDTDGVGDNADIFPNDANETLDSDADGVGDNADAFPNDASETQDSDSDGVGDNADAFPNDASETHDSDGDGIGDNAEAASNGGSVSFVTQQLSDKNYTEGPAVTDINKDGHKDIVAGQVIFLGPTYQDKIFLNSSSLEFYNGFAARFLSFVDDVNNDGWPDVISLGLPGEKAFWYKNPGVFAANAVVSGSGPSESVMTWQTFDITPFVGNEAPAYTDLNGDGIKELVFMTPGKLVYASKGTDPEALWQLHDIGFNQHFTTFVHGLGVGDLNGDGRPDIIEKSGIWIQHGSVSDPQWQREYYDFALGSKGGAQMLIYDVNGDSINDIVTSHNGHGYGLSWFEQKQISGNRSFVRHEILANNGVGDDNFSQLHALSAGDFNGDGINDFVTGKRFKPHFDLDPGTDDPAVTYLFITKPNTNGDITFDVIQIDDNSGVGVDLFTGDINGDGKRDIVTANKKGVFIHTQH